MQIERAKMRLKLVLPTKEARRIRERVLPLITVEQEEWSVDLEIVSFVGQLVVICLTPLLPRCV